MDNPPKTARPKGNKEMEISILQHETFIFVFHPYEPVRLGWDAIVMIIMIYCIVQIPYRICFEMDEAANNTWSKVDLTADIFFMIDICLQFNTGYINKSQFICSRRKIAMKYIKSWFIIDVITSIPFDMIFSSIRGNIQTLAKLLRIARIARLIKLLRLARVVNLMTQWEDNSHHSMKHTTLKLLKFLSLVFIIAHVIACAWVGICNMYRSGYDRSFENYYGYPEDCWMVRFQSTYATPNGTRYLRALYWAFTTLTTVGFGDITPLMPLEIIFTIFVQIMGSSLFGYIIGNVASLMTRDDETVLMIKEKMRAVKHYIHYRDLPEELSKKIRRHYDYSWRRSQVYKEREILSELPLAVRAECALYIHREIIKNVPFLSELGVDIVPNLVTLLKPTLAAHGDTLTQEGLIGNEMFFISVGEVSCKVSYKRDAFKTDQLTVKSLQNGDYFSEYAVIMDQARHPVSVIAEAYCDLFLLSRADFLHFGESFPLVYSKLIKMSRERYLVFFKQIVKRRNQHMMRLNYLAWQREHAHITGEDEEDTFTEDQSITTLRRKNKHLLGRKGSVVTLGMRLQYFRSNKKVSHFHSKKLHSNNSSASSLQNIWLFSQIGKLFGQVLNQTTRNSKDLDTPKIVAAAKEITPKQSSLSDEKKTTWAINSEHPPISFPNLASADTKNQTKRPVKTVKVHCSQQADAHDSLEECADDVESQASEGSCKELLPGKKSKYESQTIVETISKNDEVSKKGLLQIRPILKLQKSESCSETSFGSTQETAREATGNSRWHISRLKGQKENTTPKSLITPKLPKLFWKSFLSKQPLSQDSGLLGAIEEEKTKLPWWILVRILAWSSRAQTRVAMSRLDLLEQQYDAKFNLRARGQNGFRVTSTGSPTPSGRCNEQCKGVSAGCSGGCKQEETQNRLQALETSVEEMKAKLDDTNQLLSIIARELSKNGDKQPSETGFHLSVNALTRKTDKKRQSTIHSTVVEQQMSLSDLDDSGPDTATNSPRDMPCTKEVWARDPSTNINFLKRSDTARTKANSNETKVRPLSAAPNGTRAAFGRVSVT